MERNSAYAQKLSQLIQIETVSDINNKNPEKFRAFHEALKNMFPTLFGLMTVENFEGSLLMRWQGKNPDVKPILLMSHHDVVEATGKWSHPPFAGEIADGRLWGRGTLDTKGNLWAMLTAADELAAEGFTPSRDVYFESSCTEETDGSGADMISRELEKRGIELAFTLDEGGAVLRDPVGGSENKFAMVGVGEKGCADIKFVAKSNGGHASTPGKNTPLVRLGKFMAAADRSKLFKVKMDDATCEMLTRMGSYMKGIIGFALRHAKLFKPILCKVVPRVSAEAGAMLTTTLAFTMAGGSQGTNVLPEEAWVIGNMRFSHHQGGPASIEAVKNLAEKYDIETVILDPGFTSSISDYKTEEFQLIEKAVSNVFSGVPTIPCVMTGASDNRFFRRVSKNCFGFAPFIFGEEQMGGMHGIDENIYVNCLAGGVDFFKFILKA